MIIRNIKMQTHFDGCCNNLEYSNYINICFVNLRSLEYAALLIKIIFDASKQFLKQVNIFYGRVALVSTGRYFKFISFKNINHIIFLYNVTTQHTHAENRMIRYIDPPLG